MCCSVLAVQAMWEVPATAYICNVLGEAFGGNKATSPKAIPPFLTHQLEASLAQDGVADAFITDLHIRLLRGLHGRNSEVK